MIIRQTSNAVRPNVPVSFLASLGEEPYLYEVIAGGAGGTINPATGAYTAPSRYYSEGEKVLDTIRVTDYSGETATATVLVGSPLAIVADIIQTFMGLAPGRVFFWDQKIMQPTDSDIYITLSNVASKPFSSNTAFDPDTGKQCQMVSSMDIIDIDMKSRGPAARDRKNELIMAFNSNYASNQLLLNSIKIGSLPTKVTNLSMADGAAIPYWYKTTVTLTYAEMLRNDTEFFDSFSVQGIVDPANLKFETDHEN
jgi:hypothetical protein